MAKTAMEMTPDELKQYRPFSRNKPIDEARFYRAWEVARQAASLLYEAFGAKKVVLFGSLLHRERFASWSDIDMAVWGVPPADFFKAAAKIMDVSPEFEVDVIAGECCPDALRQKLEAEGVVL